MFQALGYLRNVSIPQAVWIACNDGRFVSLRMLLKCFNTASGIDCMQCRYYERKPRKGKFQYRKRYRLHAMPLLRAQAPQGEVSIPQAVWIACNCWKTSALRTSTCFNTASGMDCMQYVRKLLCESAVAVSIPQAVWIACNAHEDGSLEMEGNVSIPQAVWIACNRQNDNSVSLFVGFQYRKRYGLHATFRNCASRFSV